MNKILLIYTGGTIGMKASHLDGALVPFDFAQITDEVPELRKFGIQIDTISFDPVLDSSNVAPEQWYQLAGMIQEHYHHYNGFVVLHGTDTMAYTASALSFIMENLSKPIIFTGSQIPIGVLRTDGRENLVSAIEIAASGNVPEVCIYFQSTLLRANRTIKYNAEHFDAFRSPNYPPLAKAGITIKYNTPYIRSVDSFAPSLKVECGLDSNIAVLSLFPGIGPALLEGILSTPGLRGVVLRSYGSGNAPCAEWFLDTLRSAIERGIVILNVSQCALGGVNMSLYETGRALETVGVVGGGDITTEAACAKMMYLLGKKLPPQELAHALKTPLRGEITPL